MKSSKAILKISKGQFPRTVQVPGSKSYANRVLILAALKKGPFTISDLPQSSDVTFLMKALKEVGLEISGTTIQNSFPECETIGATIDVGEGGTTARFLASMLLRGSKPYTLILGERLKERPWDEFIQFIKHHGGQAELKDELLMLQGPVALPAAVEVDCSRTTQFASGLRLAFPETKIVPINLDSSQSYWDMTEELLRSFEHSDSYQVPLDWSSASYPLAFAALNHEINFPNLKYDPYQSDAKFLSVLKDFGAVTEDQGSLRITPIKAHRSLKMDVSDCLDLVPTLGYFLAHIEGEHELSGIKNLVFKESDRLKEVIKLLRIFGREAHESSGILHIKGIPSRLTQSFDLKLPDDHRMVMTAALFLRHHNGGTVTPPEAVDKSYPEFFQNFT